MLRNSTVVAVVRTRPRAIPLPMITMRKSIHGFLFPYMLMGLRVAARASGKKKSDNFFAARRNITAQRSERKMKVVHQEDH